MHPIALITGASSGIGEVFARKLAACGHDLILVARRAERLEQLARELPCQSRIIAADLTTEDGLRETEQAIRDCPNLALLINNAGFGTLGASGKPTSKARSHAPPARARHRCASPTPPSATWSRAAQAASSMSRPSPLLCKAQAT